jgi:putative restriction endonuclease
VRFWWVNQNKTYRHEVPGGYLWSPKRNSNGARNPFYEYMREVSPGDIVFSFTDKIIKAIGIVQSHGYTAPKPADFGVAGAYWDQVGWRVDVHFRELMIAVQPSQHMDRLERLLPKRYAPLLADGRGMQGVYLTSLSDKFAYALADLIGHEARVLIRGTYVSDALDTATGVGQVAWEEHQIAEITQDAKLPETTRQAIVQARRGQGLFKKNVRQIETRCRLTGVDRIEHLRASHCKPWRDADNDERLDGENGLLLTPDADHLFDAGFLSFEDSGKVLVSPVAHMASMQRMGLDPESFGNVGQFSEGQRRYLAHHRENVFLQAKLSR